MKKFLILVLLVTGSLSFAGVNIFDSDSIQKIGMEKESESFSSEKDSTIGAESGSEHTRCTQARTFGKDRTNGLFNNIEDAVETNKAQVGEA